MDKDVIALHDSSILVTHPSRNCAGTTCCIHNPSDHLLANAPLVWLDAIQLMMRQCVHGVLHPDPDDIAYKAATVSMLVALRLEAATHIACDGCCQPPEESHEEDETHDGLS